MLKILRGIFDKYFFLLLLLLVLISYGQVLGMYVWQDDNGLFFKLAHLSEKAGYLGPGPFGDGAYKYIHTPYIPVYLIFGFNTVAYFSFTLIVYLLTAFLVYKIFSHIFGERVGKLGGLLYGAGYIASDGFIRLFNSVITSTSIILISCLVLFYWKFFKERKLKWYLLALLSFFLAVEFAVGRTHYLIGIVLFFELIFLTFEKPVKSILYSLVRAIPFLLIFYQYYIVNGDHRSGQVKNLLLDLSKGEFYQLYSFITSFLNVVIPDWLTRYILNSNINLNILSWLIVPFGMGFVYMLLGNKSYGKILVPIFCLGLLFWKLSVNDLFSTQVLNLSSGQIFLVFLGGLLLILAPVMLVFLQQYRKLYLFFILWLMLNIGAYAAYNPTVSYESVNRYLAHSFLAWIGVLLIFYQESVRKPWRVAVLTLIVFWGLGNLINSVWYQHNILEQRSNPARSFYNQLRVFVPEVKKGDVFYFDVASNSLRYFDDAFSVASMPETTAIAWRYGVDRYDLTRFTEFDELVKYVKNQKVPLEKIHSFWYSDQKLADTSEFIRKALWDDNSQQLVSFIQEGETIIFKDDIPSSVPLELSIEVQATPKEGKDLSFPFPSFISNSRDIYHNNRLKQLAVNYIQSKLDLLSKAKFYSSSEWRERIQSNLYDQNVDTYWQADRILWQKGNESFTLDVGSPLAINRLAWVNGFSNNTPTKYQVEISLDGNTWQVVGKVYKIQRIETKEPQIIEFEVQNARFIKMVINETLGGDSPTIAEAWVVPVEFKDINVEDAETFIKNPFLVIDSLEDYNYLVKLFRNKGSVQIYWLNNKKDTWQANQEAVDIAFDGSLRAIKVDIPAGGTKLEKLRLSSQIPGNIIVRKITVKNLNLDEYLTF